MIIDTHKIVQLANAYAAHRGLKLSTVSTYAAKDGKLFARFSNAQASCTLRRAEILLCWFSEHWPADLAWPRDIPRPTKSKKEAA